MRDSWLGRAVVVVLLLAFLLVPLHMIESLVAEREARRRAAVAEIGSTWGGPQTLLGPVLVLPHRVVRKESVATAHAAFLPERLKIDGALVPERRRRGIFEAVVFTGTLEVSGTLPVSDVRALGLDPDNVAFTEAFLSVAVSDTRGIREEPVLLFDGARVAFRPGPGAAGLGPAGLHAPLPAFDPGKPHTFSFTLRLQGTESLSVAPLGASTEASLASPWPSPSFTGSFLPETRRTGPDGFTATWRVSSFGRAYPQSWKACPPSDAIARSLFGARLFLPADAYQQTTRALKYAVLFVGLTFLAFALFEVLGGVRLHPLQYLLAGFALALFYLLLLSLAEHAGFGPAYLAAAAATTLLIAGWGAFVLAAAARAALLGAGLATLYGYLYVLLRLEDWALVLGAAALFAILAGVMFGTRRVDWWTLGSAPPRRFSPPPAPPARA
ncbi:MAG: cell envelope integrity protein CreD [Acidobacteria bacterium]|nr:cell envelope integrity protein CreD [Acidobacteriota bacterium]